MRQSRNQNLVRSGDYDCDFDDEDEDDDERVRFIEGACIVPTPLPFTSGNDDTGHPILLADPHTSQPANAFPTTPSADGRS